MKTNKIFDIINDKMQHIEKNHRTSGSIVVSKDIYYDIRSGYYNSMSNYPFFPDFTSIKKPMYDRLFGLPLCILQTTNKEYIEVFAK